MADKLKNIEKRTAEKGFKVTNTHFSGTGIRTNASIEDIVKVLK